jgi:hypothetical protein
MANQSHKPRRMAPLQQLELVPIADLGKQAALDQQRRQVKDAVPGGRIQGGVKMWEAATASQALDLCRRLSPKERFLVLAQLVQELPPDQQLALVPQGRAKRAR